MLRDYNISGRINLMEIPVLLHMLHFWKVSLSVKLLLCFLFLIESITLLRVRDKSCELSHSIARSRLTPKYFQTAFLKFDRHHSGKTSRYFLKIPRNKRFDNHTHNLVHEAQTGPLQRHKLICLSQLQSASDSLGGWC